MLLCLYRDICMLFVFILGMYLCYVGLWECTSDGDALSCLILEVNTFYYAISNKVPF